jgi:ankyrin repeat protein
MTMTRSDVVWIFSYTASCYGHVEIIKLLLNNKAVPNKCCVGESPLYIASRHGRTEIVEVLLNNKADPNICFAGESPLYIAYFHGHAEIVELLLNNKSVPNICCIQQQFDNLCMTVKRSDL